MRATAMTFVITVVSRAGIWQASDRRLSRGSSPLPRQSTKHLSLACSDGKALISYAGVGAASEQGIEVSEWMGKLLRGRDMSIGHALALIADAATRRFSKIAIPHTFVVGAAVNGDPRLYAITNRTVQKSSSGRSEWAITKRFRIISIRLNDNPRYIIINFEGSGALALNMISLDEFPHGKLIVDDKYVNLLCRLIRRRWNKPRLRFEVMSYLIYLIKVASKKNSDTVSDACLVSYLNPKDGTVEYRRHKVPSTSETPYFTPAIALGWDIKQLIETVFPEMTRNMLEWVERDRRGETEVPEPDAKRINRLLSEKNWNPTDEFK